MRRKFLSVLVALFSAGWLFPMWLGVSTYLDFWEVEAWPLLDGDHPGNSFPFLSFARDCFAWGFSWLALALLFWAYIAFSRFATPSGAQGAR